MENKLRDWLRNIVEKLELCPFYKQYHEKDVPISMTDLRLTAKVELQIKSLSAHPSFLLYSSNHEISFDELLDLSELYQQIYPEFTVVPFHPKFKFIDTDDNDRINYVNRSPTPLLHFIKAELFLRNIKLGESINRANETKLSKLNDKEFKRIFKVIDEI